MAALRIVFMGTAPLSCASLEALAASPGSEVVAAVTQPDRPKGRDLKLQPSAAKECALRLSLPLLQPERVREGSFIEELRTLRPELICVAAYGQILPKAVLDLPQYGCINVHTSLLPKYRGAAPIQWAILNDEPETGVTIMKMDEGLDTGAVLAQETTPILPDDTSETLLDRLATIGADLLVRTIPGFVTGKVTPRPQPPDGASYAPKIKKEDGLLDWNQPARQLWNRVRGLMPWPGAFTVMREPTSTALLKIWQAEAAVESGPTGEVLRADKGGIVVGCGQGALRVLTLQREGGRRLSAAQFLAGHGLQPGFRLG